MTESNYDSVEFPPFDDIDCSEDLLRDIEVEVGLSDLYDSIKRDVEACEEEEIAQKVLTGLIENAAAMLETSINLSSRSQLKTNQASQSTTQTSLISPNSVATPSTSTFDSLLPRQLKPTLSWKLDQLECLHDKYNFRFNDILDIADFKGNFIANWYNRMGDKPWKNGIVFIKALDGFSQLDEEDQVVLVRSMASEYGAPSNAMATGADGKKFVFEDERRQKILIDIDFLNSMMGMDSSEITRAYQDRNKKVLRSCLPEWRMNRKLMLLLVGIALFNPDRQRLRDRCRVWKIQEFFYDLLRKYLTVLYPREADARLAFVGLIGFLAGIREVSKVSLKDFYEAQVPFFKNWFDHHSPPLAREVFGIKEC